MLDGSIPESMGHITYLKVLDLSLNNISGKIPDWLGKPQRLNNLNLSYNRLAGEVPSTQSFKSYRRRSFMGNADLCGSSALTELPSCEMLLMHKQRKYGRRVYLLVAIRVGSGLLCIVIVVVYIRRYYPKKAAFSEYTVAHVGFLAKINPVTLLDKVCVLSCEISTGLALSLLLTYILYVIVEQAIYIVTNLSYLCLKAAKGARVSGELRIIGVDLNANRFEGGSIAAMISAFECVHDGWGVAVQVGVPNKDGAFKMHPMNILNERTLKGTSFGNYKPRSGVVEK
ncbi:hypothetical protein GIB67_042045 [Kingdonia uniflora]|uniref:alcohol dehydrogenase n=1 Tax=Kingdonia uniflora TaxID=39325 RepID=A0A7J7MVU8_9MAGN|nr:hypothetical protein GIB67_042045 [Kingdonia uniflora]